MAAGVRDADPCVVVLVEPSSADPDRIPSELDGFPVDVRPTGDLRPL